MTSLVSVTLISGVLEQLLHHSVRSIAYDCRATEERILFSPDAAASPNGLLPVLLVAADTIWREATGKSFGITLQARPQTIFGFEILAIRSGTFATVGLALLEVIESSTLDGFLLVNDLALLCNQAEERMAWVSHPRGQA